MKHKYLVITKCYNGFHDGTLIYERVSPDTVNQGRPSDAPECKYQLAGNPLPAHNMSMDQKRLLLTKSSALTGILFSVLSATMFMVEFVKSARADSLSQPAGAVATRDPRLPPILPGETVETESGDKIKVWSSSGGVGSNQSPPPPAAPVPGNVEVYVDKGPRRHYDRDDFTVPNAHSR